MAAIWNGIKKTVLWSYERGTWPYDLLVAAILIFVFLTPRSWFSDPRSISAADHVQGITLLEWDPLAHTQTYRVDVHVLAPPTHTPQLEKETHEVLRKNVDALRERDFQVVAIRAVRDDQGNVLYYSVTVK